MALQPVTEKHTKSPHHTMNALCSHGEERARGPLPQINAKDGHWAAPSAASGLAG